jgi:hypothetical protein
MALIRDYKFAGVFIEALSFDNPNATCGESRFEFTKMVANIATAEI